MDEKVKCENCGSENVRVNTESPDDRPYIIVTHYKCDDCKSYWYEED